MNNPIELGSRRVLAPGRYRWVRAVAWAIDLLTAVLVTSAVVAALAYAGGAMLAHTPAAQIPGGVPGWVHLAALCLMALTALATYWWLVRLGEGRSPSELALSRAAPELLIGLAIGAAMMAVTVALMWAGGWVSLSASPVTTVSRAVALSIQSGVVEEVLFRLIVLRLLSRAFGPVAALASSAFIFGALHVMNPNATWFAAVCIMIEAGIMLAGFYILTGRLWVSIGVHASWNFTQGWVFGAAVSGTSMFAGGPLSFRPLPGAPAFLSGDGFGPEASLAGLLVGTSVGALTLWLAWKRGRFQAGARDEGAAAPAVAAPEA